MLKINGIRNQVLNQAYYHIKSQAGSVIQSQVWNQAGRPVYMQIYTHVLKQIRDQIRDDSNVKSQ